MPFLLIAGLGNPGFRYEKTRHNIGFRFLDAAAVNAGFPPFSYERKFLGFVSRRDEADRRVILLKPDTYMNLSGNSVQAVVRYFGIAPEEIVVVHDDLDIPFGTLKIKTTGGAAGHKGLDSIIASIGTPQFGRIRLGIGRPPAGMEGKDYVLTPFSADEEEAISRLWVPIWCELFAVILREGLTAAANRFANRSCLPPVPKESAGSVS